MRRADSVNLVSQLRNDGYAILPEALSDRDVDALLRAIEPLDRDLEEAARGGLRDALRRSPAIREVVEHAAVRDAVRTVLGGGAFAVRGILFDKRPNANWKVPWHRDRTIAVRERRDAPGFGPWSVKGGTPHVQPPIEVLERMLAVRVHLDPCGAENGPLRVLPGTHREGRLKSDDVPAAGRDEVACEVPRGGILLMRPLLLHASSSARSPARRRVLHLDFAAFELGHGLEWAEGAS